MNNIDIEKIADNVCNSTDFNIKSTSQKLFLQFCNKLIPQDYVNILQNYSQTVIFVLMEYTYRNLSRSVQIKHIFQSIYQVLKRWYNINCQFLRNGNKLKKHVLNSIGRTLGQSIKILFREKETKVFIVDVITKQSVCRFRLYLWKIFIEAVSQIDTQMGFLNYRNLIYSFQQQIIPKITQQLIPYFMSVTQTIKINQLSSLQSQMSVSQNSKLQKILIFTKQQQIFSNLIFSILKQIICFTYNITYSQYDMQNSFQNSTICFPQILTMKIVSKQFLQSLFFIIQKLINDLPNSQFLNICLDCLQKILLCRMTYLQKQTRKGFLGIVLSGMNRILKHNNLNQNNIIKILQANIKFLNNIQMHKLRKFQPQFTQWLITIKNLTISIISKTMLTCQNILLKCSLQLITKILALSISPKLQQYSQQFRNISKQILQYFLRYFYQNQYNIMGQIKIRKIKQLKKLSSIFFNPIKLLITIDFKVNFILLNNIGQVLINSNNYIKICNYLLLVIQLIDSNYLERNIFYQIPTKQDIQYQGIIIVKCLKFIGQWYQNNNNSIDLLEITFMIFIQKLIIQCLKGIEWKEQKLQLTSQIYSLIQKQMRIQSPQLFLMSCFKQIIRGLQSSKLQRVQYALQILSQQLMKFKWGLKRDNFKSTKIAKQMLIFCTQASRSSLKGDMLKLRKQLFRIITLVNFDDVMDSFKQNIDNVIQQIYNKLSNQPQDVIYDLTGICQTIDTSNIYKYFLIKLDSRIGIKKLIQLLFTNFANDPKKLKAILKLHLSMIQNRSQRLANGKISYKLYSLLEILIPYWNSIIVQIQSQQWSSLIYQIHKIFRAMVRGYHINFFLLEKVTKQQSSKFIFLIIQSMVNCSKWCYQYPKIFEILLQNGLIVMRQLSDVILTKDSPQLQQIFSELLLFYLKLNIKLLKQLIQGNKKIQPQLQKSLDITKTILIHFRTDLKYPHKIIQCKNIQLILKHKFNQKQQYLVQLFKFCLGNGRNYQTIVRTVYMIIQQMSILYNNSYDKIMKQLGIDQNKIKALSNAWNNQLLGQNDLFICNLKDWFKLCDTDYILQIDY